MERNERIKFWLNDEELTTLDKQAREAGLSRSAYIRKMINETEVIPAPDIDYGLYSSEFRRLGNNLNLRLKRMNTTGEIDCDEIDRILIEIKKTADLFLKDLRAHTAHLESEG